MQVPYNVVPYKEKCVSMKTASFKRNLPVKHLLQGLHTKYANSVCNSRLLAVTKIVEIESYSKDFVDSN